MIDSQFIDWLIAKQGQKVAIRISDDSFWNSAEKKESDSWESWVPKMTVSTVYKNKIKSKFRLKPSEEWPEESGYIQGLVLQNPKNAKQSFLILTHLLQKTQWGEWTETILHPPYLGEDYAITMEGEAPRFFQHGLYGHDMYMLDSLWEWLPQALAHGVARLYKISPGKHVLDAANLIEIISDHRRANIIDFLMEHQANLASATVWLAEGGFVDGGLFNSELYFDWYAFMQQSVAHFAISGSWKHATLVKFVLAEKDNIMWQIRNSLLPIPSSSALPTPPQPKVAMSRVDKLHTLKWRVYEIPDLNIRDELTVDELLESFDAFVEKTYAS